MERVEGIIYDPKRNLEVDFVWQLRPASNNKVEVITAYKGLQVLGNLSVKWAVVVVYLFIVIYLLRHQVPSKTPHLTILIHFIKVNAKD